MHGQNSAPRTPEELAAAQDQARQAAIKRQQIREESARVAREERLARLFGKKEEGAAYETAPESKPQSIPDKNIRSPSLEQREPIEPRGEIGEDAFDLGITETSTSKLTSPKPSR